MIRIFGRTLVEFGPADERQDALVEAFEQERCEISQVGVRDLAAESESSQRAMFERLQCTGERPVERSIVLGRGGKRVRV